MGERFRFIHAADLHIDSPFRGLTDAPEYVRRALSDSTLEAAKRLTMAAIEHQADFIVIAGDLYDSADRSLRAQLTLQREWEKLHAHGVQLFVVHGNHDPLAGGQAKLDWPGNVHVFGADTVEAVPAYTRAGQLAAYVHGISFGVRAVKENLALRFQALPEDAYQIGLLHANLEGNSAHDPYAPCSLVDLTGAGFHYWALGHIHQRAVVHRDPYIVYPGNVQGRHAKETGPKGCCVVDVSPARETQLTFLPLHVIQWEEAAVNIAGLESEQALLDAMEKAVVLAAGQPSCPVMARISLTGRGVLHAKLRDAVFVRELLEAVRERLEMTQQESAWIWVSSLAVRTAAPLRLDALAEEDSFAGELYRLTAELLQDGEGAGKLLAEALEPFAASSRLRRILDVLHAEEKLLLAQEAGELASSMLLEGLAEMQAYSPDGEDKPE